MRLICTAALLTAALSPALGYGEKVQGEELANLPWSTLKDRLSTLDSLLDTTPADYVDQCVPEFRKNKDNRSMYHLVDQPSGLCMAALFTAFVSGDPFPVPPNTTVGAFGIDELEPFLDSSNPRYDLPPKVLFPAVAKDVVAAVAFAKKHNVELSVKNSGHDYVASSTKSDTLLINMNKYEQYAFGGLVECDADIAPMDDTKDLSNQVCKLALARGKRGTLHIGGGENFDRMYRAVDRWNKDNEENGYKYHVAGGGTGSVSPMGWTAKGGLASTTYGRKYGLGVDQVLQIEMVLPNGQHVRFGPTLWEDASSDGYIYPKTKKVSGVCNEKSTAEDKSMWEWKACPEDINFDDLWFATRGGGGGTWGVILSIHVQLHEDPGEVSLVSTPPGYMKYLMDNQYAVVPKPLYRAAMEFLFKFMLQPESLGLSEDDSNRCGSSTFLFFYCYGTGAGAIFVTAWKDYVDNETVALLDMGVSPESLTSYRDYDLIIPNSTWTDFIASLPKITEGTYEGRVLEKPTPLVRGQQELVYNFLLPKKCILENWDVFIDLFTVAKGDAGFLHDSLYFAFGTNPGITHDQTASLSEAHREAGVMLFALQQWSPEILSKFTSCYDMTNKNSFPPMYGSNHAGPNHVGPLRSDWTQNCPFDWTDEKRERECIPQQEAIYGTERLARLEEIKKNIDPTYIFNCNKCIGNNQIAPPTPVPKSSKTKKTEKKTGKKGDKKTGKKSDKKKKIKKSVHK